MKIYKPLSVTISYEDEVFFDGCFAWGKLSNETGKLVISVRKNAPKHTLFHEISHSWSELYFNNINDDYEEIVADVVAQATLKLLDIEDDNVSQAILHSKHFDAQLLSTHVRRAAKILKLMFDGDTKNIACERKYFDAVKAAMAILGVEDENA